MAFSTKRGRPRKPPAALDLGTPELRFKHAHGLTTEPVDLCLQADLITNDQHWCALHLRWLHTLRYGAQSLTGRYATETDLHAPAPDDPLWRSEREAEYREATTLLQSHRRYTQVMALAVYNKLPSFLNHALRQHAWNDTAIAASLDNAHRELGEGLDILVKHWRRSNRKQNERRESE